MIDNKGTGYYVHAGAAPVRSVRRPQKWFYLWPDYLVDKNTDPLEARLPKFKNDKFRDLPDADLAQYYKPTTGDFALAYFEHGRKPDAAGCVYSMLIKTTSGEMARFAGEMGKPAAGFDVPASRKGTSPPYVILHEDAKAHVLWDRDTATTGYVIFNAGWQGSSEPPPGGDGCGGTGVPKLELSLRSASRPCLVMLRGETAKGSSDSRRRLKVSVASTDWKNESPLALQLNGRWEIASTDAAREAIVKHDRGVTTIEIAHDKQRSTMNYMPVHIVLR